MNIKLHSTTLLVNDHGRKVDVKTQASKLREVDRRLLDLPGRAKVEALLCGLGTTRKEVARLAGEHAMDVTRELRGEGNPRPRVRAALSAVLKVPTSEIDSALETV